MSLRKVVLTMLWPFAIVAIIAVSVASLPDIQNGKVSAWMILPFFWGGAAVAVGVRQLAQLRDPIGRYLARHKPLAGPRPGAELPG
jgi:hypothetical protein